MLFFCCFLLFFSEIMFPNSEYTAPCIRYYYTTSKLTGGTTHDTMPSSIVYFVVYSLVGLSQHGGRTMLFVVRCMCVLLLLLPACCCSFWCCHLDNDIGQKIKAKQDTDTSWLVLRIDNIWRWSEPGRTWRLIHQYQSVWRMQKRYFRTSKYFFICLRMICI